MAVMMVTNGWPGMNIIAAVIRFTQRPTLRNQAGLRKVARSGLLHAFLLPARHESHCRAIGKACPETHSHAEYDSRIFMNLKGKTVSIQRHRCAFEGGMAAMGNQPLAARGNGCGQSGEPRPAE
jgi:hypothetical protein